MQKKMRKNFKILQDNFTKLTLKMFENLKFLKFAKICKTFLQKFYRICLREDDFLGDLEKCENMLYWMQKK